MFERLTDRLTDAFRSLSGRGVLTEKNVTDAMRDVRRALLEADVNYQVVKTFVNDVKSECLGDKVLKSVTPGQQAVKVVSDRLTALLGDSNVPLDLDAKLTVIMLVGLHGSGKTTTAAKLARHLGKREGKRVMVAACDLHRPAAIDQLEILGNQLDIPVFVDRDTKDVPGLAVAARNAAMAQGVDILILDTAGRHQIDDVLVHELVDVKRRAQPREILLVADAALGQEAVSVAEHFDQALGITGLILTKMDGDARGGAALSMREVTGQPIKFIGVGEALEDLQPFFPDRMASRILGMGDVVGLVEKAAEHFEEEEAKQLEQKMRKNTFDLEDFRSQLRKMRKMGGLLSMLDLLPGMGKIKDQVNIDENQFKRIEGIICSMTPGERTKPATISTSRRARIATGSGVATGDVGQLLKQFEMMKKMMGNMGAMEKMAGALQGGAGGPGGMPAMGGMLPGSGQMPSYGGGRKGTHMTKAKKKRSKKKRR